MIPQDFYTAIHVALIVYVTLVAPLVLWAFRVQTRAEAAHRRLDRLEKERAEDIQLIRDLADEQHKILVLLEGIQTELRLTRRERNGG